MDFLEKLPIVSGACFLIGLFLMAGGIRIIRDGRYLFVSRYTSPDKWQKPKLLRGKNVIPHGIGYIFVGLLFVILAIAVYSEGL